MSSVETMKEWPMLIRSEEEMPAIYQDVFPGYSGSFPYTVFLPSTGAFWNRTNPKLICMFDDRIYVLETQANRASSTCYPLEDIVYVECGRVLLKSWITINGVSSSASVVFNTVRDYMLEPFVRNVRASKAHLRLPEGRDEEHREELCKCDYLCELNFKYMNYARQSILPGERIARIVYQPDICVRSLRMFGRSLLNVCLTAHLIILTDKELITIREDKGVITSIGRTRGGIRHGGVFSYLPLEGIVGLAFDAHNGDGNVTLSIRLSGDRSIHATFSPDNADLDSFSVTFDSLKGLKDGRNPGRDAGGGLCDDVA